MGRVPYSPYHLCVIDDADRLLTKRHTLSADIGEASTENYDHSYRSVASLHNVDTVEELSRFLTVLQRYPHKAVHRGQPLPEFFGKRCRRLIKPDIDLATGEIIDPETYIEAPRGWMMIDGDKLELPAGLSLEDDPEVCIGWYRN